MPSDCICFILFMFS